MAKFGLGCAQIGMPYAGRIDLMPEDEAIALLWAAYDMGVRFFDTARAYGESEARIKKANLPKDAVICSKMKRAWPSIDCQITLLHKVENHLELLALGKRASTNSEFGASVYSLKEAKMALECRYVKWLEVPVNIIDNRFMDPVFIGACKKKGVKLIGRSVLLQGILWPSGRIPKVAKADMLLKLQNLVNPTANVPFDYVFGNCGEILDVALIGCDSVRQLRISIELAKASVPITDYSDDMVDAKEYATKNKLWDPRTWVR